MYSAEEGLIDDYLADDDRLNKSDEPTVVHQSPRIVRDETNIQVNVPQVAEREEFPTMYHDTDSISTFRSKTPSTILPHSSIFHPQIVPNTPSVVDTSLSSSIPINVDEAEEDGSVSKMSDTETRISHLEMHYSIFT